MATEGTTVWVERWLDKLSNADPEVRRQARDALLEHSKRRIEALCRKMFYQSLAGSPVDWQDIYQEAALKLWKALEHIQPMTTREFFGLASAQIRRVLVDMYRKHGKRMVPELNVPDGQSTSSGVDWEKFWILVEQLSPPLRVVYDLIWIQDLSQKEASELLGLDESTVKRRWRKIRKLFEECLLLDGSDDSSNEADV